MTRTPVSTNGTFSSIPKKGTSGYQKKNFLPDSFLGGLREYYTEKWLKNSKKNSLVLAGLILITISLYALVNCNPVCLFQKQQLSPCEVKLGTHHLPCGCNTIGGDLSSVKQSSAMAGAR